MFPLMLSLIADFVITPNHGFSHLEFVSKHKFKNWLYKTF